LFEKYSRLLFLDYNGINVVKLASVWRPSNLQVYALRRVADELRTKGRVTYELAVSHYSTARWRRSPVELLTFRQHGRWMS